jgi:hypothetical protein
VSLAHLTGQPSDFGGFPPFAARAVPIPSAYATKMRSSLVLAQTVAGRIAFSAALYGRLAKLDNRIDPEMQGKILGAIHAKVPMVTPDEQRGLQIENAEDDERLWSQMRDMQASTIEDHKALATDAQKAISSLTAGMAEAEQRAASAKERAQKLKNGENLSGGLSKSAPDFEKILRDAGWTKADLRHARELNELGNRGLFEVFLAYTRERSQKVAERFEHKTARDFLTLSSSSVRTSNSLGSRGPSEL